MRPRVWRGIIVVFTSLALWPLLHNGLATFDDRIAILENAARWALFSFDKGAFEPLAWLALALMHAAFGVQPWAYHAVSLITHLASGLLVFELGRILFPAGRRRDFAAAAGALFFCLHPLQIQAVAQAASLGDLLATLFGLAAVRAHLARRPSLVLGLFVASALCHWQAAVLPLILLALDYWRTRRRPKPDRSLFAVALALVAVTLLVKSRYESGSTHALRPQNIFPGAAYFLGKLVAPWGLTSIAFPRGGLTPVIAVAAIASLKRGALVAFVCWLLLLTPTHMLSVDGVFYVVARYAYAATAVAALAFGWAALRAPVAALALFALAPLANLHARIWRDPLTIVAHDLAVNPEHGGYFLRTPQDRASLGAELMQAGFRDQAEGQLRRALAADPSLAHAHNNLGALLASKGDLGAAAEHFAEAARLSPALPGARENLERARAAERPND